jgi:hypothetical protein
MEGCKWKLCDMGVASTLFIGAAYDYNTIVSNSVACPFLGDVSGSFCDVAVEYRLFFVLDRSLLLYTF